MRESLFIMAFLLLYALPAQAEIYKYVDEEGIVCYTDAPYGKKGRPQQTVGDRKVKNPETVRATAAVAAEPSAPQKDYSHLIHKAASKYNLEPELIKAVIKTESNGNHRAVSRKGAIGLMQLMPTTAIDMNVSNPFNPEENIEGGTRYLKYLLERFNGNLTLALAAYNSGPKTVEKYGNVPPIDETRQYVKRIFNLYNGRKNYSVSEVAVAAADTAPLKEKHTPIYRVVLDDGTILFTNATLENNKKLRL